MNHMFLVLLTVLFLYSCKETIEKEPPVNLIEESTYVNLYVELHLFNAMVEAVDTVMNQDSLLSALYKKYSINEDEFKVSHAYYQSQTQLQQIRLDSASARLARTLEALNAPRILQPNQLNDNTQDSRPQN